MNRAKPPANTMIAEQANKIRCISRRSRFPDGIRSTKRIVTSRIQSYSDWKRESGSGRPRMHKQILLPFRVINLTLTNLKNELRSADCPCNPALARRFVSLRTGSRIRLALMLLEQWLILRIGLVICPSRETSVLYRTRAEHPTHLDVFVKTRVR